MAVVVLLLGKESLCLSVQGVVRARRLPLLLVVTVLWLLLSFLLLLMLLVLLLLELLVLLLLVLLVLLLLPPAFVRFIGASLHVFFCFGEPLAFPQRLQQVMFFLRGLGL